MKKIILPAFCLGLILNCMHVTALSFIPCAAHSLSATKDERKVIKTEDLPEAIKNVLASEAYKEWKIKEAVLVKIVGAHNRPDLATQYEVTLKKGKEIKTVRFLENGTVDN